MNIIFQSFLGFEAIDYFNSLEIAKTKLESMKIVREQKRRAVEQAELEALEAFALISMDDGAAEG